MTVNEEIVNYTDYKIKNRKFLKVRIMLQLNNTASVFFKKNSLFHGVNLNMPMSKCIFPVKEKQFNNKFIK